MRRRLFGLVVSVTAFGLFVRCAAASTTGVLLPTSDGNYLQWTPTTGTTHYTLVDESACNGTTDYNSTGTAGNRDSYGVNLSSIVNGATITQIDLAPCASRNNNGSGSATLDVFYRFNGINSSDSGSYALSGTIPTQLATTTFASLDLLKTSTSTLEIGSILSAGNRGARLSRIATVLTYELTTGVQMTATPPDSSKPTGSIALTLTPGTSESILFDAASSGGCSANCDTNINWSHTVSGPNRGLLVFVQGYDSCTYGVLYGNTAMTEVAETASFDGGMRTYAYKMENPPTSATGVSVWSDPGCGWEAGAVSYQGVNQTNMIDTVATSTNPAYVVASVTTTPTVATSTIVSAHGEQSPSAGWTPGSGQTERVDDVAVAGNRSITVTDVFSAIAGIARQMTSQPPDFSKPTGSVVVSLKPY